MITSRDSRTPHTREKQFQELVDSIEIDGIFMLDCAGHVLTWNRGAEMCKGYSRQEILGKHFKILFVPEDVKAGVPDLLLAKATRLGRYAGEGWRLRKNGERFWATFVVAAMRDPEGDLIGFSKVIRDMSEKKCQEDSLLASQEALQEERDRMYAAAESSLDAIMICEAMRDAGGQIRDFFFTYLNRSVEKLAFPSPNLMLGGRMRVLLRDLCDEGLFEKCKQVVFSGEPSIEDILVEDPDHRTSWFRIQAVKLKDGVAISASDITDCKHNEQMAEHLAHHDSLTGLLNRSLLADRADLSIAFARREGCMVGFLLIDIDEFKRINDTFGHAVGDAVLCTVASRLSSAVRASDTIIRFGGDEFVAIIPGIHAMKELVVVVDKILQAIRSPIVNGDHTITLTCSVGIAVYPASALTVGDLLKRADIAMYGSKDAGKNQYRFFGHHASELDSNTPDLLGASESDDLPQGADPTIATPKPVSQRKSNPARARPLKTKGESR